MVNSRSSFPLRANDPDTFKQWLYGGIQDLGKPAVEEQLMDDNLVIYTKYFLYDRICINTRTSDGCRGNLRAPRQSRIRWCNPSPCNNSTGILTRVPRLWSEGSSHSAAPLALGLVKA